MPKLTFEIEILDTETLEADKKAVRVHVYKLDYINNIQNITEVGELERSKQSKEMYYKGLWNKYFAEIDLLSDGEFSDIALLISEQINKAHKLRMQLRQQNDAKLKGLIIN